MRDLVEHSRSGRRQRAHCCGRDCLAGQNKSRDDNALHGVRVAAYRALVREDGYPYQPHTCLHCVGIRKFVATNIPCFCWAHGNLLDDCRNIIEAAYDQAADEVRGLAFGFGRLIVKAKRARSA